MTSDNREYTKCRGNRYRYLRLRSYRAPSNSSFLGLLMAGEGEIRAGLERTQSVMHEANACSTHIEVPVIAAGLPMMILSDTPAMESVLPSAEASKR